jgi:ankyrin repeat protein
MASEANERLCDAAMGGDVAGIAALLLAGADPDAFEGTGDMTPLLWAAYHGHVAVIAALLAAGARVDGASSYGTTPLMGAAESGQAAVVAALLAAGADVHRVNNGGDTVLHLASRWGPMDSARVLLDAGARTDVRDKFGNRPMDRVRAPARLMRLRGRVTALRFHVEIRRCGQATLPSAHCWPPLNPGPAAGPSPSPATVTCGSGRRRSRGGGGW